jgi:hypothetical protein
MDFIEARLKRRSVLAILKQQQAEDADCINQIKTVALDGKRRLLKTVATWLTAINGGAPISDRTRTTFAKITHRVSLDGWVALMRNQTEL